MLHFLLGAMAGSALGVCIMCILFVGSREDDMREYLDRKLEEEEKEEKAEGKETEGTNPAKQR